MQTVTLNGPLPTTEGGHITTQRKQMSDPFDQQKVKMLKCSLTRPLHFKILELNVTHTTLRTFDKEKLLYNGFVVRLCRHFVF